ncbi:MAG TPA: iron-containing alcohol dehydrogenase [Candidatus Baltobacteraceae bacterium]|nr:iron-containing alcohol dehydrogenase [Candidatus Baltobacteraceae bacterium]
MSVSDERIAERRIMFGPLSDALHALALPGPVAVLGSPRSVALIPDDALRGRIVDRFDGARSHNPRETVDAARAFVDARGSATAIAIGSSSAIDLGKAVAETSDVTLVVVPTALGGAEMSRGYGMVEGDRKKGGRLASPAPIVIYDAALLASLPPRELGSIGINAWAHTIEASYAKTQHALGTAAARTAGRALPALLKHAAQQRDEALHRELFEAAHLAGFALDTRSMGLHHAVCHVVGGLTQIPHGIVNAVVLPHAIRANARIAPGAVRGVGDAFGIGDLAAEAEAIAEAFALPRSFRALGAPGDLAERALPLVMKQPLLDNNPARPEEADVRELLSRAYG